MAAALAAAVLVPAPAPWGQHPAVTALLLAAGAVALLGSWTTASP